MSLSKKTKLTLYGKVGIARAWCGMCETMSFVIDNKLQCCDTQHLETPTQWRRESAPPDNRTQPRKSLKKQLLEFQGNSCLYCEQKFNKTVRVRSKSKRTRLSKLRITWDHFIPYSYNQNRKDDNWVAACQFCNSWKSDRLFNSVEEARVYLKQQWEIKGEKP